MSWLICELCMYRGGYKNLEKRNNQKAERAEQIYQLRENKIRSFNFTKLEGFGKCLRLYLKPEGFKNIDDYPGLRN